MAESLRHGPINNKADELEMMMKRENHPGLLTLTIGYDPERKKALLQCYYPHLEYKDPYELLDLLQKAASELKALLDTHHKPNGAST